MAAALALLPWAYAAEPDDVIAADGRHLASDRAYVPPAKTPRLRALAPAEEALQLCTEEREPADDGMRLVDRS
jgi:hypothetical protein